MVLDARGSFVLDVPCVWPCPASVQDPAPDSLWHTWLGFVDSFITDFDELGVEIPVDFAEVTEDDLMSMGLPCLQKRRFATAAVQVRLTTFWGKC